MELISTWYHDTNPKQFNCQVQIEKMKRGPNPELRIQNFKNRNGCGIVADKPRRTINGISFHNCYCDHLADIGYWLQLHSKYESGIMPFPGAYVDQPAKVIEIFNVLDRLKAERELELRKEQERTR